MSSVERQYSAGYLKKLLIMFLTTFLMLAICNNIYAGDDVEFMEKACDIYKKFNPILSFIILVVVITTAIAALFGKLSMAVVVTVMITAIVMKQAPQIVNLVTNNEDLKTCINSTGSTTVKTPPGGST